MRGFENTKTEVLQVIRNNLLTGLDKVAKSIEDGTFHTVGEKGKASPAQAGQLTLSLLVAIDAELRTRNQL